MAEFPALPLWTDRYLAATLHLTVAESGAYLHLLMAAWRSEDCRLPDDDARLARFARCTPGQWKRMRETVLAFWERDADGFWIQRKLQKTKFEVSRRVTANRENASAGGRAKALKDKEARVATATISACPDPSDGVPNQNQNHKKEKTSKKKVGNENGSEPRREAPANHFVIRAGSEQHRAWKRYYHRINSSRVYAYDAASSSGEPLYEPKLWPPSG